jgi:lysophospholipase L1-like esterase
MSTESKAIIARSLVDPGNPARLQRVFHKARLGEPIIVGVLGGSITAGASATTVENRWANLMTAWWREAFPLTPVELVNAGIGATGSDLGAHRVQPHLLDRHPDFVVLEYAVNDTINPIADKTFEGVVRRILSQPWSPAVMVLFTMNHVGESKQELHAPVCRHYGIPMVSFRDAIYPEIEAGRLTWDDVGADVVHPNDAGHVWAAQFLANALDRALTWFPESAEPPAVPSLPEPLHGDAYERAAYWNADTAAVMEMKGWKKADDPQFGPGWLATEPGSTLEVELDGTELALTYHHVKDDVGIIEVAVDGGPAKRIDAWFKEDWGGGYTPFVSLAEGLDPGKHRVRVTLLEDRNPESNGHRFRLVCYMSAGMKE